METYGSQDGAQTSHTPCRQLQPQAWGNAKAVLTSNGTVIWIPQCTFKVQCHREGNDGPKTYKCKFIVGSWVHNKRQVELQDHGSSTIDNYLGPRSSWLLSGERNPRVTYVLSDEDTCFRVQLQDSGEVLPVLPG